MNTVAVFIFAAVSGVAAVGWIAFAMTYARLVDERNRWSRLMNAIEVYVLSNSIDNAERLIHAKPDTQRDQLGEA